MRSLLRPWRSLRSDPTPPARPSGAGPTDVVQTEPASAVATPTEQAAVALGPPSAEPSARPTLRDPGLQAAFERDGYVVAQVLDPAHLAGLLEAYAALEHHHEDWLPFAQGFHTTLYDARQDYRAQVAEAFDCWVAPGLDKVLADHRVQFANFQVKLPGAEHLPEHVDWTFVDETRVRSVTVWTATHDMDEANGGLGVAPESHRLVDFDRAVNQRFYDRHAAAVASIAERRPVVLRAGEAVIFDNRLLHYSTPNTTDRPRLAASCVASPAEEPVYHYWFDEDERAHRIRVTPEFWLSYVIGSDPRRVEGAHDDILVSGTFA